MIPISADPNLPLQPDEFHRTQLRRLLGLCFSLDEIKTLAFDTGVDFDELGGETKTSKIRELILFAERENKIDALVAATGRERPDIH